MQKKYDFQSIYHGSFSSWLVYFVDINTQKLVVETLKDNSELKMIQRELESANSQLLFKNKELEQFAYIASHNLQEPLRKNYDYAFPCRSAFIRRSKKAILLRPNYINGHAIVRADY